MEKLNNRRYPDGTPRKILDTTKIKNLAGAPKSISRWHKTVSERILN